ncbi:MAG: SGNH/GDSL hydrolase family protein [Sphingobium sp.]
MGAIGDSITTADFNGSDRVSLPVTVNDNSGAHGYMTWALTLSGQRVSMPLRQYVWGFPGKETSEIFAAIPSFLAQMPRKPSTLVVECGTNNIFHNAATGTFESITSDWTAIAAYLTARGIRVIFIPILPRTTGFSTLFTAAQFEVLDRCNRWLNAFAANSKGTIAVASSCLIDLTDPTSVGAQPKANLFGDGTHPAVGGGYYIGKAVSAILNTWYPPIDLLPSSSLVWSAGTPRANLLPNPMMSGTSGTVTAPAAGTAPTSWTASMTTVTGLTMTVSKVTSVYDGSPMTQLSFGGTYSVTGRPTADYVAAPIMGRIVSSVSGSATAGLLDGDTVESLIAFEIDQGNNCINAPKLELRWEGATGYNRAMGEGAQGWLPSEAVRGVLRTAPHTYSGNALNAPQLLAYAFLRCTDGTYNPSATIRFGRAVIQKVES